MTRSHSPSRGRRVLPFLFGAGIFTSAFLLMAVQPMAAKRLLPFLGGAPAVWSTCMMFFQLMLLAGYAYAHLLTVRVPRRYQAAVHSLLLAASFIAAGAVAAPVSEQVAGHPSLWIVNYLLLTVGLPFGMLASTSPLLQRWYAELVSNKDSAYRLYALSNGASVLGVFAYPLLIEPWLGLSSQASAWQWAYRIWAIVVAAGAWLWAGRTNVAHVTAAPPSAARTPIRGRDATVWLLYAWVPSSLMLAVTSYISIDIASVPFFWLIPFGLYLMTMTVAFSGGARPIVEWAMRLAPAAVVYELFVVVGEVGLLNITASLALHMICLGIITLACHAALAARRPREEAMTAYFLIIGVGGALGGVFNALIAPLIFDTAAELSITLLVAAFATAGGVLSAGMEARLVPAALGTAAVACIALANTLVPDLGQKWSAQTGGAKLWLYATAFALPIVVLKKPVLFGVSVGLVVIALSGSKPPGELLRERSFFGVMSVRDTPDGAIRRLYHGTTLHGAQLTEVVEKDARNEPLTYFGRDSPVGQALNASLTSKGASANIAIIGLGVGTLAAYGTRGQTFTFYEIDPLVEQIATSGRLFSYIPDAIARGVHVRVVQGDARLRLEAAPDGSYDVIIIDAFASDAIPLHIMTLEAVQLYMRKRAPDGILLFHVSNRHFDLVEVLAALAHAEGSAVFFARGQAGPRLIVPSDWVLMAQPGWASGRDVGASPSAPTLRWIPVSPQRDSPVWRDDYASLLHVLR